MLDESIAVRQLDAKMVKLLRFQAALYMGMVPELLEAGGEVDGEAAIRKWIRRYGQWRGREIRKGHLAMGYPISMESLLKHWDNGSTAELDEAWEKGTAVPAHFSPHLTITPVIGQGSCVHCDVWRTHDFWHWGYTYCEENHQAVVSGYRPGAAVVIPTNMMKHGDESCDFMWVMPPEDVMPPSDSYEWLDAGSVGEMSREELAWYRRLWESSTPSEASLSYMVRTLRLNAVMWRFVCEELAELSPTTAVAACKRGLASSSVLRGRELLDMHGQLGFTPSPRTFLAHYDQMLSPLAQPEVVVADDGSATAVITTCPLNDVWDEIGHFDKSLVRIYCEESYAAALANYLPGSSFELSSAISRGDSVCRMTVTPAR